MYYKILILITSPRIYMELIYIVVSMHTEEYKIA